MAAAAPRLLGRRDAPPDVDDVGAYALRRMAGFSDEARATLLARVAEAGRGNFLYARYVVDGLLAAPPTGVDPVTVALPAGLEGHYREFLEREVAEADDSWRRLYRPLLGILAVARGDGVTRAQLAGAARLRRSDADDALEALEQYLDASGPDGPFRFYHESFRDFLLAEETYRVYPDEAHAALGGFLAGEHADDWLRCRDAYALAHAPAHLTAAAGMAPDARTRNDLVRDVEALLVRLDFVAAKAFAEGTSSVEADLRTVEALDAADARLPQLRRVAAQCGSLLARCSSAEEAAATLASRVEHLDDLSKAASELRRMLGSPYVENWHMLPDLPHPSLFRSFPPDTFGLGDCDVSADCVVVAAAYDDCVRVWDANRGVEILTLEAPSSCCALSADGKRLAAGGEGGSVTVLSIDDNRECFTLDTSDDAIVRCALDGTGSTLVAASTGE